MVWITTNCGKFFKRWEYKTSLPTFLETCTHVKKQQLELEMEQQTGFKLENQFEYIMWNPGLEEAQTGIKIAGRNINNLRFADNTTLMAEVKKILMKVK